MKDTTVPENIIFDTHGVYAKGVRRGNTDAVPDKPHWTGVFAKELQPQPRRIKHITNRLENWIWQRLATAENVPIDPAG